MKVHMKGEYHFALRFPDGRVEDLGRKDNTILLTGLDLIATPNDVTPWNNACQVGSGTTPSADTDTQLESLLYATTAREGGVGIWSGEQGAGATIWQYTFPAQASDYTVEEVGVGTATDGSGVLFSRTAPLGISVPATAELVVTYYLYNVINTADTVYSVTIAGADYTATSRPASLTEHLETQSAGTWAPLSTATGVMAEASVAASVYLSTGVITDIDSAPPNTTATVETFDTYVPGSYSATLTATSTPFSTSDFNSVVITTPIGKWQIGLDTPLHVEGGSTIALTFNIAWSGL